jgi:predicted phage gp36 major capsid-like protein
MTTAASRFLAYGDFQQFVIVGRVGTGSDLVIPSAVQVIAKS